MGVFKVDAHVIRDRSMIYLTKKTRVKIQPEDDTHGHRGYEAQAVPRPLTAPTLDTGQLIGQGFRVWRVQSLRLAQVDINKLISPHPKKSLCYDPRCVSATRITRSQRRIRCGKPYCVNFNLG